MAWAAPRPLLPPLLKDIFDRNLEKLVFFLNQVWAHLDQHGREYANDEAIVANLKGVAAEWVTALRDERTTELADLDAFLGELRT